MLYCPQSSFRINFMTQGAHMNRLIWLLSSFVFAISNIHAEVTFSDAWARPGQPNGAVFVKLHNGDGETRRVVSAQSDVSERTELHDHLLEGSVYKMRKVDSLEVPANGSLELMPGGKHVMLLGIRRNLTPGESIMVTLTLDNGEDVRIAVPVKPMTYNPKLAGSGCGCNKQ
jgi:periplasmic copper chaperone A